jgi:hypothetical protein
MPVMVRRGRRRRQYQTKPRTDPIDEKGFITPGDVESAHVDAKTMLGDMPKETDCRLIGNIFKLNHQCQWVHRCLALTDDILCFSYDKKEAIRDQILLEEVMLEIIPYSDDHPT